MLFSVLTNGARHVLCFLNRSCIVENAMLRDCGKNWRQPDHLLQSILDVSPTVPKYWDQINVQSGLELMIKCRMLKLLFLFLLCYNRNVKLELVSNNSSS